MNGSSTTGPNTPAQLVTKCFLYAVLFMLGCTFNGSIIWLVHKHRSLQTVTHMWVVSLCWSHLLTSATSIPFAIISTASDDWHLGKDFCRVFGYYTFVFRTVSIVSVAGIAVDRYHVISRPFSKRMQKRTAKVLISFTWWSSLVACSPPLIGVGLYRYSPNHHMCQVSWISGGPGLVYTVFYMTAVYFSTVLTTLCSYRLIHKVTQIQAMKHKRPAETRFSKHGQASARAPAETKPSDESESSSKNNRLAKLLSSCCVTLASHFQSRTTCNSRPNIDRKASQIMLMVLFVFLFAWTPYFGYAFHSAISGELRTNLSAGRGWLEFIVTWLALSTCIWDPLLYAAFTKNFRSHIRSLFGCLRVPLRHFSSTPTTAKSSSSQSATKIDTTEQSEGRIDKKMHNRQRSRLTNATGVSCDVHDDYRFERSPAIVGSLADEVLRSLSQTPVTTTLRRHRNSKNHCGLTMASSENRSYVDDVDIASQAVVEVHQNRKTSQELKLAKYRESKAMRLSQAERFSHISYEKRSYSGHDQEAASSFTSVFTHKTNPLVYERNQAINIKAKPKENAVKFLMIKTPSQSVTPTKEIALKPIDLNKKVQKTKMLPLQNFGDRTNTVASARSEMRT